MENWPALVCVTTITLLFVVPAWVYIQVTERRAKIERDKAVEAGRHEPVTIQPYVNLSVCMGSGACVTACPENVLKVIDGQAVAVNMSACIGHGACVTACPVDAIELVFGSEKRGIDIPEVGPNFETNVPGLFVAGELGGMGLIANAAEQGVKALANATQGLAKREGRHDVVIVGAGPAGIAAALAAKQRGMDYLLLDQEEIGGAIRHYPRKKLVFTRAMDLPLYGKVNLKQLQKEELVDLFADVVKKTGLQIATWERVDAIQRLPDGGFELTTSKRKVQGQRVILALGRRGTPRKLEVRGEEQDKVAYSLLEPEHYQYDHLLVVGGGDSAVEAAIQLAEQPGNRVWLSYRGEKINRPKEKNIERLREAVKAGRVEVLLESQVREIGSDRVVIEQKGEQVVLPNDYVFVMVGGVLPTKFLQAAGVRIAKHFGKRVEVQGVDEVPVGRPRKGDPPTALLPDNNAPTTILPPPPGDDQTVPRAKLDEPTISLPPGMEETTAPRPGVGEPLPPVPMGLASLDTRVLREPPPEPPAPEPDPGANRAGHVRHREVTEIQPLKRVATPGADARPPATPPRAQEETRPIEPVRAASREETVPLGDRPELAERAPSPPPPPARTPEPARSPDPAAGRVVATNKPGAPRPRPDPRAPAHEPRPEPAAEPVAAPVSAMASRLARNVVAARSQPRGATPAPAEPRPEPRPRSSPPTGRTSAPPPAPEPAPPPEPGDDSGVVQPFVQAARQLLADGQYGEVLRMAAEMAALVERSAATLSERDVARARRWSALLEGEARLGLGEWLEATGPLEAAVDAARVEGSPEGLARALAAFGRACHHTGRFDRARLALEEALRTFEPPPAERVGTLRLLGDLALRRGDVETAEQRFGEALAGSGGSRDAEARAYRGLAHCRAIRGEFEEALELLARASALLGPDAEPRVRAGVLAREIELENLTGRYAAALQHGEALVALTNANRLVDLRPEALALLAETLGAIGLFDDATDAALQAADLARDRTGPPFQRGRAIDAQLRAARVLCDVGKPAQAAVVLRAVDPGGDGADGSDPGGLGSHVLDDPHGQLVALRARSVARTDPALARELANEALARPSPMLQIRAARIRLDAAMALIEAGANSAARSAVKRGLKILQGHGTRGLKLELLVAMYLAAPDHRVVEAVARTGLKVLELVPAHAADAFRARPVVGDALARWRE